MLDLKLVKQYLRIDFDFEDDLLKHFIKTSESYMRSAINDYDHLIADEKLKPKVEMCEMVIVQDLYENRNQAGYGIKDFGYTIRSMIGQLQFESGDSL